MAQHQAARLSLLLLVLGTALVALSPIFVRLSELGPTATAFHRAFLALPILLIWLRARGPRLLQTDTPRKELSRKDRFLLGLAGLFFAGDLATWHWSITMTSVANATLFANSAPIFVTLGAWFLFRERVTPLFLLALALALLGTVIVVGSSFQIDRNHMLGDGMGVVTGMFWAAYQLTVKYLRERLSAATIMTWSSLVTATALLPLVLVSGEELVAQTLYGWGVLLALAWLSHAGGQGAIAQALAHLPIAFSSLVILLEPVVAAFLAWIVLAEPLGPLQAAGCGVVLASILVARQATSSDHMDTVVDSKSDSTPMS
jgi:drug/metabolite transporter (DMT)-like permease